MAIHDNLKQLRTASGMTQEQVAEKLHLTRQAVSNYEAGRTRPDIDTLMQRAMGLDTAGNAEQAWCYRYANGEALQVISEPFLLLLRDPLKGWATMQNREQQQLQEYLQPFLQNNPAPNARVGDSPITAALSNLDAVLRQYPQLHFMSPAGRQQERILTLELPEIPLQTEDLLAEPVYAEQGFPYAQGLKEAGEFRDFPLADYPELTTPEALHAMQLLDILRAYPATMPYTAPGGHTLARAGIRRQNRQSPRRLRAAQAHAPLGWHYAPVARST